MSESKKYISDIPKLINEWDWEKNTEENLDPYSLTHGSTKKAHWICPNKHKYIARIDHRTVMNSGCPYCAGKLPIIGENDLATLHPELLEEWDYDKNEKSPEQYTVGSNKPVFWVCKVCRHEWKTAIVHRTLGHGCPECAKIQRAKNRTKTYIKNNGSFADVYPELVHEWNTELNLPLTPYNVTAGSDKKVWWYCSKCNNNYEMSVCNKSNGQGCSICAGKVVIQGYNDLATTHPELAEEWHTTKNDHEPTQLSAGSGKEIWWKCKVCKYEWKTPLYSRTTTGSGCPVCVNRVIIKGYNDLATTHPDLVKEWHPTKNGDLLPTAVAPGSHKKVWWMCAEGHEWEAVISSRTNGCGCNVCAQKDRLDARMEALLEKKGSLAENNPDLAKEWHPEKNGDTTPYDVTAGSDKKVWWICHQGHEWEATISSRVHGNGCPECVKERFTSFPEQAILYYLSMVTKAESRKKVCGYEVDIYLPELSAGVEYNGWYYHKNRKSFDDKKKQGLRSNGIRLICVEERKDLENNVVVDKENDIIYFKYQNRKISSFKDLIIALQQVMQLRDINIDLERDEPQIYSQYIENNKSNSVAGKYPWLIDQWNYQRNGSLTPWQISYGSNKKVWWKCEKCGHEWKAVVHSRKRAGCPLCSNRVVLQGVNDLASQRPDLLKEWDFDKNTISPEGITKNSHKYAWWKCKYGHNWYAQIKSRNRGCGCPICYKNSLSKTL